MAQQPFKKWVKAAGIEKKLSFHCLRHSFATLLISLGIDVSVVSKMFTHRSVKNTMIYADVVSEKKRGRCLYPLLFRQPPKHPVPSVGTFRRPPRNPRHDPHRHQYQLPRPGRHRPLPNSRPSSTGSSRPQRSTASSTSPMRTTVHSPPTKSPAAASPATASDPLPLMIP